MPIAPADARPRDPPAADKPAANVTAPGAWRYAGGHTSRIMFALALLTSAGLHGLLLFGSKLYTTKPPPPVAVEEIKVIRLAIPELKDLEEPERVATDEPVEQVDLAIPVPMQSDLPQLPRPNDFVQALNFASLLEQPELNNTNLTIIPEHFTRATRIAENIGKIFNLDDLDRHPEPMLQPAPTYPFALRREGIPATVLVEFIVDVQGRVLEAIVIDSSHSGFNEAAVLGVSKWKFRPGTKGGRKVNVRMRVPILFKVVDPLD
jgi:protein TonB